MMAIYTPRKPKMIATSTAERAAEEGLDGHPTYIISTDDTAKAVEQYITLYDNIK